jgi:hypothetical protein
MHTQSRLALCMVYYAENVIVSVQDHSITQTLLTTCTPSFPTAHWRINVCCILDVITSPSNCSCPVACASVQYEATVSYSYFPAAEYFSKQLAHSFNSLKVNVYFDTLNIETQTTDEACIAILPLLSCQTLVDKLYSFCMGLSVSSATCIE